MLRRAVVASVVAACLAALSSCREATEIRIDARCDDACGDVTDTRIFVGASVEATLRPDASAETQGCRSGAIGSLVLYPSGDGTAKVAVRVVTSLGGAPVEAKRVLHFVPHTSLTLPIEISAACKNLTCQDVSATCVDGKCVSADVGACTGTCELSPDGGVDATSPDAVASDAVAASDVVSLDGARLDAAVADARACPGLTPNVIDCGNTPCAADQNHSCCQNNNMYICTALLAPCGSTLNFGFKDDCDEAADCAPGYVCCSVATTTGSHFACVTGPCDVTGQIQKCKQDCECLPIDGGCAKCSGMCVPC